MQNGWKMQYKDPPEHAHCLLRSMMAAQDYAGAARVLATLHRLHVLFDPDVYRYTVALLHLSGDHQVCEVARMKMVTALALPTLI